MDYDYYRLKKKLTKKEIEVAILISKGMTHKKIAELWFIAPVTVRRHACNICEKADVEDRTEFRLRFPDLIENFKLDPKLSELENNLESAINLSWDDNNQFEDYFSDFSNMIRSMFLMDFSIRLEETDDKNSLFNFIAKSLNLVNEELEAQFKELQKNQKEP